MGGRGWGVAGVGGGGGLRVEWERPGDGGGLEEAWRRGGGLCAPPGDLRMRLQYPLPSAVSSSLGWR